jgi:hypothetical protein
MPFPKTIKNDLVGFVIRFSSAINLSFLSLTGKIANNSSEAIPLNVPIRILCSTRCF